MSPQAREVLTHLTIRETPYGWWHAQGGWLDYADPPRQAKREVLPRCRNCGTVATTYPHAPHYDASKRLVDCAGREVRP